MQNKGPILKQAISSLGNLLFSRKHIIDLAVVSGQIIDNLLKKKGMTRAIRARFGMALQKL